jgi:hypothetical protein
MRPITVHFLLRVRKSLTKIRLGEEELCAIGYHGAQEHNPIGRNVEAKQRSGKEEVGYQSGRGTTWSIRRSRPTSPATQGMMGTGQGR